MSTATQRQWEQLAGEAIADAGYWKNQCRRLQAGLKAARACLTQPVQYTGSESAGAANILRADAKAAVAYIDAAAHRAAVMSIDYFRFAAETRMPYARKRTSSSLTVELDGFSVEASYHLAGRHWPATETSPEELPAIVIDEARLTCGDFTVIAPFDSLAESVRERVVSAISQEEFS